LVVPAESRTPVRIDVRSATHSYSVVIGAGVLREAASLLGQAGLPAPAAIVSSPPIWQLHGERLAGLAEQTPDTSIAEPVLIPDGERAKTLRTVATLYDAFVTRGLDRSSTILALGGGVVGDVAGFAAATYLRGLSFVQAPTTLLAQVDSAVGGKVGVNLQAGKNLVGAFHAPALVLVDPEVLVTLRRREFRAGLYEVVKYGVIASRDLFERVARGLRDLMRRNADTLQPIVSECCRIKAALVSEDEHEAGPRRVLNFGHTIGHALEAVTRYKRLRHGEAVAYGMLAAADLSAARGLMPEDDRALLLDIVRRMGPLPGIADLKADEVIGAMARDKKRIAGTLHFVLCAGIGGTEIVNDVRAEELTRSLASIGLT
jgi:3-dehydroquinate synthase